MTEKIFPVRLMAQTEATVIQYPGSARSHLAFLLNIDKQTQNIHFFPKELITFIRFSVDF